MSIIPPPTTETLEDLMGQALGGDSRAYAALLQQSTRHLHALLARKIAPHDRDDVVQDILLALHKARHTYDSARPFLPWLMAIARYRLHDHWRAYYRHNSQNMDNIDDHAENLGHDVTESIETHEELRRGMAALSAKQRAIIEQMYGKDRSVQEVATNLGMNLSAVKVAAHRAYKALRQRLEQE